MKAKKIILAFLLMLTVLNVMSLVVPQLISCTCYRNGEKYCDGDCCGGSGLCNCYDAGTDNCKQIAI